MKTKQEILVNYLSTDTFSQDTLNKIYQAMSEYAGEPDMDYTFAAILADVSGSMHHLKGDMIGGYNAFIDEQKAEPGKMSFMAAKFSFSHNYSYLSEMVDINDAKHITSEDYTCGGSTALNDSMAKLINELKSKIEAMPKNARPGKVIVMCMTDGEENDSKEYTTAKLKELIASTEKDLGWKYIYAGANQDSFQESHARGMSAGYNFMAESGNKTSKGIKGTMANLSNATKFMRSASTTAYNTVSVDGLLQEFATTFDANLDKEEDNKA